MPKKVEAAAVQRAALLTVGCRLNSICKIHLHRDCKSRYICKIRLLLFSMDIYRIQFATWEGEQLDDLTGREQVT